MVQPTDIYLSTLLAGKEWPRAMSIFHNELKTGFLINR